MTVHILQGDALTMLATLPSESVQVCVTSPPYFALRDYGVAGQIGLEQTPGEFIARLVAVFEEVRRVLHPTGLVFCNLGDSYAGSGKGPTGGNGIGDQEQRQGFTGGRGATSLFVERGDDPSFYNEQQRSPSAPGIPQKSLMLIPERFAIAMQEAGWIVRSRIAWTKASAMPESVRDRPSSAWEHIWMFSKSARYFFDQTALAEACAQYDADAVRSVKYRHGNEGLPGLRAESSVGGLLSEGWSSSNGMQTVRACPRHGLETDRQGQSIESRGNEEVQRERSRPGETSGLSGDECRPGVEAEIRPDREGTGSIEEGERLPSGSRQKTAVLRERQRQGDDCPLSADAEGARVATARGTQKTSAQDGATAAVEHADAGRVGRDQSDIRPCLCVLRPDGSSADAGPCSPAVEGWTSHEGEHPSRLPSLQQPTKQSGPSTPNARNFWLLGPEPSNLAHYAAYPTELVRRCILAGTSAKGQCPACGAPWARSVSHPCEACGAPIAPQAKRCPACSHVRDWKQGRTARAEMLATDWSTPGIGTPRLPGGFSNTNVGAGWAPSCSCNAGDPVPQTVLDPFLGSGTTALVADRLERNAIGVELNPQYAEMARKRVASDCPMFADVEVAS